MAQRRFSFSGISMTLPQRALDTARAWKTKASLELKTLASGSKRPRQSVEPMCARAPPPTQRPDARVTETHPFCLASQDDRGDAAPVAERESRPQRR